MTISANYLSLISMFAYGFQVGATAVIGNVIGEENEMLGKVLCLLTFIYTTIITCILASLTYTYAYEIAHMYTEDMDTAALLKNCLESLSGAIALQGFALSLQGALKALQQ